MSETGWEVVNPVVGGINWKSWVKSRSSLVEGLWCCLGAVEGPQLLVLLGIAGCTDDVGKSFSATSWEQRVGRTGR